MLIRVATLRLFLSASCFGLLFFSTMPKAHATRNGRAQRPVTAKNAHLFLGSGGFRTKARQQFLRSRMRSFLGSNVERVLLIPFSLAEADYGKVIATMQRIQAFGDRELVEIHRLRDPAKAIADLTTSDAVYLHGGNTFRMVAGLHTRGLIEPIRAAATERDVPITGISAGANVIGLSIGTTNDNPVVAAPTLEALGLLRLNVKPHYVPGVKRIPGSGGKRWSGEPHDERIDDFHAEPGNVQNVLGFWEGTVVQVQDGRVELLGAEGRGGTLHRQGARKEPIVIEPNTDITSLLRKHQPDGIGDL